jgi:RNA polymerase sigma-70 factor (ECF subfamily)
MPDISALIQRWQAGDDRAAEALYNHCREPVFRLACGLLGDPANAEEAAQDALAHALTHIGHYDPRRGRFTTWLYTIVVSRCRDRQRRHRLPFLSLTAWLQRGGSLPDPAPVPEQRVIREETRGKVWVDDFRFEQEVPQ